MATCNKPVGSGVMSFLCDLDSGHEGPHRAQGNDRSLRARAEWEQSQRTLSETQGKPMTSAERWGDGEATGTPPPGYFRCKYHGVVHHNDQRSPKCMAWSSDHDGPMPTRIQRPEATMGDATVLGPLPDMPGDAEGTPMVFEQQGDKLVEQPRTWNGQTDAGPYSCPACGSVGTGAGMPGHLLSEHPDRYVAAPEQYEKTKDREGDQPMPIPNDRASAHDLLTAIVQGRKDLGLHRYDSLLQPFNGRDSSLDAIEELVDLGVYLVTHREERTELLPLLDELEPMIGMSMRGREIVDRLRAYLSGASA